MQVGSGQPFVFVGVVASPTNEELTLGEHAPTGNDAIYSALRLPLTSADVDVQASFVLEHVVTSKV